MHYIFIFLLFIKYRLKNIKKYTNHSEFINTVVIKRFYNFILPFPVQNTFNAFKTAALQQPIKSFVHSGHKKKRLFSLILQFETKNKIN